MSEKNERYRVELEDLKKWGSGFVDSKDSPDFSGEIFKEDNAAIRIDFEKNYTQNEIRITLGALNGPLQHRWFIDHYRKLVHNKCAQSLILKANGESEILTEHGVEHYKIDKSLKGLVSVLESEGAELKDTVEIHVHAYMKSSSDTELNNEYKKEDLISIFKKNKDLNAQQRYIDILLKYNDAGLIKDVYPHISHYHLKKKVLDFMKQKLEYDHIEEMLLSKTISEQELVDELVVFLMENEKKLSHAKPTLEMLLPDAESYSLHMMLPQKIQRLGIAPRNNSSLQDNTLQKKFDLLQGEKCEEEMMKRIVAKSLTILRNQRIFDKRDDWEIVEDALQNILESTDVQALHSAFRYIADAEDKVEKRILFRLMELKAYVFILDIVSKYSLGKNLKVKCKKFLMNEENPYADLCKILLSRNEY